MAASGNEKNTIKKIGKDFATPNLVPGMKVYNEKLVQQAGKEYRIWEPTRSKLCAALHNGLKTQPIVPGSKILYLGASTGTTVSHVSDIVGPTGIIYAVEFSERVLRELLPVADARKNIVPILADARKPESYSWIERVDVVYCDIAQPDQTEVAIRNCVAFLKPRGFLMLSVKSRSIDISRSPKKIFKSEVEKLEHAEFKVIECIELAPHELDHAFIVAQRD